MADEKKGWFRGALDKIEDEVETQQAQHAASASQAGNLVIEKQPMSDVASPANAPRQGRHHDYGEGTRPLPMAGAVVSMTDTRNEFVTRGHR